MRSSSTVIKQFPVKLCRRFIRSFDSNYLTYRLDDDPKLMNQHASNLLRLSAVSCEVDSDQPQLS